MIDRFLKAKHWQIFLLTFGIPFLFQIFMMVSMVVGFTAEPDTAPQMMFRYMPFFTIVMMIFMVVFFSWFWSVAIGLQKFIPSEIKLNVVRFKFFFFTPLIYIVFFMTFFLSLQTASKPNPSIFAFVIPLHFFAMFCIFYCLYFVSKTFRTAELKREVHFSDYAGEFFLIWFFPIGIWIIQPRINKMVEDGLRSPGI